MSSPVSPLVQIGIPDSALAQVNDLLAQSEARTSPQCSQTNASTSGLATALCWLHPSLDTELEAVLGAEWRQRQAVVVLVPEQALELAENTEWPRHWQWAPWPLSANRLRLYLQLATAAAQEDVTESHTRSGRAWNDIGKQLFGALRAAGMFEFEYDLSTGARRTHIRDQFGENSSPRNFEDVLDLVHTDDRLAVAAAFRLSAETGADFRTSARVRVDDSGYRWMRSVGKVVRHGETDCGRLLGITWDIHQEQLTKQSEALARQRLAATLSIGGIYSWEWHAGKPKRMLLTEGDDQASGEGERVCLDEMIGPEDNESDALRFATAVERGERYSNEVSVTFRFNQVRRFLLCGVPRKDANGNTTAMMGVAMDLTEQRAMQAELVEARALLIESLEAGQMYCWQWDLAVGTTRTLGPCREILGISPTNPALMTSLIHPEDANNNCALLMNAIGQGQPFRNEFRVIRPDGNVRWISTRTKSVVDQRGKLERLIGISMDVTNRRVATDRLRQTQERMAVALDAAKLNPWSVNLSNGVGEGGPRDIEIYGVEVRSREQFLSLVVTEDRLVVDQLHDHEFLHSGEPLHVEFRIRRADGELRWVSCYAKSILDKHRIPVSLVGVSQDISESRQAQEQLAQSLIQLDRVQTATNVVLWEWCRLQGFSGYAAGGITLRRAEVPQIHPQDWWSVARGLIACSRSDAVLDEEVRIDNGHGGYFWVSLQGRRTEFAADGSAIVSGVMIDVSARKRDRERVAAAEERLHQALVAANMRCWDWHANASEPQTDPLHSYTPTVLRDQHARPGKVHPEDQVRHRLAIQTALEGRQNNYRCQFRVIEPDGGVIWLLSIGRCVADAQGGVRLTGVAIDISAQKALEAELEESRQWQRIAVDAAELNLSRVDTETGLRLGGDRDLHLLGSSPETLDQLLALIHSDDRAPVESAFRACVERGEDYNFDCRVCPPDRPMRWVRVRGKRVRDSLTGHNLIVAATRDISSQRRAEEELRDALAIAQQASLAKSAFLASVSHELRTPLNAVIGYANLIEEACFDGHQQNHLRVLKSSANQLLGLVTDVLDFSRIEAGELNLEERPFCLQDCLESAIDVVAGDAEAKRLCLLMTSNGAQAQSVVGDSTRLRQVLLNLLSNAVKFTDSGAVIAELRTEQRGAEVSVSCVVRDTGAGMPAETLSRLFSPFHQGDISTTRRYGGSGLGLSICKRLIESMGGRIDCESEPDKGSVFRFELCLPITDQNDSAADSSALPSRVGIVVGAAAMRDALIYQLTEFGVANEAIAPTRCKDALDGKRSFDVIVVGAPALPLLRKIENWPTTKAGTPCPVIVLARIEQTLGGRVGKHGERYWPISRALKPRELRDALCRAHGLGPDSDATKATRDHASNSEMDSLTGLRVLLVEDNEINRTLIQIQVEKIGPTLKSAESGEKALAILANESFDVVLMDLEMPGLDGFETTARMRAGGLASQPYVIAVTAHVLSGVQERIRAAGMDDFVSKPVNVEKLRLALLRSLSQ